MDSDYLSAAAAIVVAYLLGSFPTAYLVARLGKGVDIRRVGSRNMGAMNTFYSVGIGFGALVLIVDIGKGMAAILIARWLGAPFVIELVAGGLAVAGHIFPVFLRFRGGKGGAVAVGVLAILLPKAVPFAVGIFLLVLLITRFPTLSYSLGLAIAPLGAWLIYHSGALTVFSIIILLAVLARYFSRILEMRSAGGSWRRVLVRRSLKDRF